MDSVILSADFCSVPISYGPHYHSCHEILYVTRGSAHIQINQRDYDIIPGNLVIFSRFEQHSVEFTSEDYQRYVLKTAPSQSFFAPESYRLFSLLFNRPDRFHNILSFPEGEIEALMARITGEFHHPRAMGGDMLNLLMQELLICVFRQYGDLMDTVPGESLDAVREIQSLFEADFGREYTLEELARTYSVSVSHLSHLFRRVTGRPVMGYLGACRIAGAKKDLSCTDLPVGRIAERCGFGDASNFSRTFRACTGCSPTEFRRKYRGETP